MVALLDLSHNLPTPWPEDSPLHCWPLIFLPSLLTEDGPCTVGRELLQPAQALLLFADTDIFLNKTLPVSSGWKRALS